MREDSDDITNSHTCEVLNALGEGVDVVLLEQFFLLVKAAEQEEEAPAITADDMVEQLAVEEKTGKEKDLRGLVMG